MAAESELIVRARTLLAQKDALKTQVAVQSADVDRRSAELAQSEAALRAAGIDPNQVDSELKRVESHLASLLSVYDRFSKTTPFDAAGMKAALAELGVKL